MTINDRLSGFFTLIETLVVNLSKYLILKISRSFHSSYSYNEFLAILFLWHSKLYSDGTNSQ